MEPVWRSKEKEYTLYLGARDRQSTCVQLPLLPQQCWIACGPFCAFFSFAVYCNKWPYLVLSSPPSQCLPTCCMAGGMLALWHRLSMASSCRGSLQLGLLAHSRFHCPWELAPILQTWQVALDLLYLKLMCTKLCHAGDSCKTATAVLSLSCCSAPCTGSL